MVKNLQIAIFWGQGHSWPWRPKRALFSVTGDFLNNPIMFETFKEIIFKAPKMAEILEFLGHFVDLQVIFEEAKRNSIPSPGPLQPNGNSAGGIAGGGGT